MKTGYYINTTIGRLTKDEATLYFKSKSSAKNHELWFAAKEKWELVSVKSVKLLDDVQTI